MPYYTQQQYEDRFGTDEAVRLTDETNSGNVDAAAFTEAIADVDAVIDSYIGKRYTLPLDSTPRVLTNIAAALVREALHVQFPTETVTMAAKQARADLKDIQAGRSSLPLDDGTEPEQTQSQTTRITGPDRKFTQSHLDKM